MIVKQVHCGQYIRYGDFYRVWEIENPGEMDESAVREYCRENLTNRDLPEKAEFLQQIRGAKSGDYSYYFRGYYTLEKTETGYKFTICEPYAD